MTTLLDSDEIVKELKISYPTLYRWRQKGMPYSQPAGKRGRILFDLDAVYAWLTGLSSQITAVPPTEPPKAAKPKKVKAQKEEIETQELHAIGSHVKMKKEAIIGFIKEDGERYFNANIERINDYCAAKGKTYKDWAAVYRNFRRDDPNRPISRVNPMPTTMAQILSPSITPLPAPVSAKPKEEEPEKPPVISPELREKLDILYSRIGLPKQRVYGTSER